MEAGAGQADKSREFRGGLQRHELGIIFDERIDTQASAQGRERRTHCGLGAPQSQHLSLPAPSFFCIAASYTPPGQP